MGFEYQKKHQVHGKRFKYWVNLQKAYFDTGLGLTNYAKYIIGLLAIDGIFRRSLTITIIAAIFYLVFCYFLGLWWLKKGWYEQQLEVSNKFNPFVKTMLGRK